MTSLPYFPPKKLFPLSPFQVDERRVELERFIQNGRHYRTDSILCVDFFVIFEIIIIRPHCNTT